MHKTTGDLTARDVYQVLKDVALGTRTLRRLGGSLAGQIDIEVEGWQLTLVSEDNTLSHCQACESPDGKLGTADSWQRYGTDPVKLLSIWEHQQLLNLLNTSQPQE